MKKKANAEAYLLLSNTVLVACAAAVLGAAVYFHRRGIETTTLDDNRFLTTEWHLLQELKAQTDEMLREKDHEISRLRAQYRESKDRALSPGLLEELEAELKRAEEERAAILSSRLAARPQAFAPSSAGDRSAEPSAQTPARTASTPLSALLAETASASVQGTTPSSAVAAPPGGDAPVGTATASEAYDKLTRLLELKIGEIDSEPPPKIESIRTRTLIRALVNSPSIRSEYPDLLEALDRSFEDYGRQEWLKGQKAAYVFATEAIKGLRK